MDSYRSNDAETNPGQAAYWRVAMGDDAAREFNYLWHQCGRLENIWAALQDWLDASPEDKHQVAQKLSSFNGVMLDAMWTSLVLGLAAFGDARGMDGSEPIGIPAWLARHKKEFPKGSKKVRAFMLGELYWGLWPIKTLRNTQLAHWDKDFVAQGGMALHRDDITVAFGQIEYSFRLIEGCFAKSHLMHMPPFNHFNGMRHYIQAVKAWNGNPFE